MSRSDRAEGIAGGCVLRRSVGEGFLLGDSLVVVTKCTESRVWFRIVSQDTTIFRRLNTKDAIAELEAKLAALRAR